MGTNWFCLFRLFDVWKPWPIRVADQKVAGGFGIMLTTSLQGFGRHSVSSYLLLSGA